MFNWMKKKTGGLAAPSTASAVQAMSNAIDTDVFTTMIQDRLAQKNQYTPYEYTWQDQPDMSGQAQRIMMEVHKAQAEAQRNLLAHRLKIEQFEQEMELRYQQFVSTFFPMHLPEGWGFRPVASNSFTLYAPRDYSYSVRLRKGQQPDIQLQQRNGQHPRDEYLFADKETFLLHLITLNAEITNETN